MSFSQPAVVFWCWKNMNRALEIATSESSSKWYVMFITDCYKHLLHASFTQRPFRNENFSTRGNFSNQSPVERLGPQKCLVSRIGNTRYM